MVRLPISSRVDQLEIEITINGIGHPEKRVFCESVVMIQERYLFAGGQGQSAIGSRRNMAVLFAKDHPDTGIFLSVTLQTGADGLV